MLLRATAWSDGAGVRRAAKSTCGALAQGRGAGSGDVTTVIGEETGAECINVLRPWGGVPCVFSLAIGG